MLTQQQIDAFMALEMGFPPVAVKFSGEKPENLTQSDKKLALCQFAKEAQVSGEAFFIALENEACTGAVCLGMRPLDSVHASGKIGEDSELFQSAAANARLHTQYPILPKGTADYVSFAPLSKCNFDPDLVLCLANNSQAEILMRATSYISGDLWESKSSIVNSCAWLYSYPYTSGKVNFCITGLHFGMKRMGVYPPGMHLISIPHQKLSEVATALVEMPWTPLPFRTDAESMAEMERKASAWNL